MPSVGRPLITWCYRWNLIWILVSSIIFFLQTRFHIPESGPIITELRPRFLTYTMHARLTILDIDMTDNDRRSIFVGEKYMYNTYPTLRPSYYNVRGCTINPYPKALWMQENGARRSLCPRVNQSLSGLPSYSGLDGQNVTILLPHVLTPNGVIHFWGQL